MKGNRFVIVGLGQIGADLIGRLSRDFELTVIELEESAAKEALAKLKREDVELIVGDATSRLVLEDARALQADALIITTTDERVNVEVASQARRNFKGLRVISVALTEDVVLQLEQLGVEVVDVFSAGAMGIRNIIEGKSRAAHGIGLGKDEILEVEVHPNSRLANKPLGGLAPIRWRVGIIYRDGNIIIPKPETVLKPRDRMVVLGDPAVLKTVSEILTFSFQKFPLEYGSDVLAFATMDDIGPLAGEMKTGQDEGAEGGGGEGGESEGAVVKGFIGELNYIFSVFPLNRLTLTVLDGGEAEVAEMLGERLSQKEAAIKATALPIQGAFRAAMEEGIQKPGLVVLSSSIASSLGSVFKGAGGGRFVRRALSEARCPVFFLRGTFPYEKVVTPCIANTNVAHELETAIEIGNMLGTGVTALRVRPSRYIADDEERTAYEESEMTISNMSFIYKKKVDVRELRGNPVHAVLGELQDFNLLVARGGGGGAGGGGGGGAEGLFGRLTAFLNPDVLWTVVRRSPVSTVLLPSIEESL